MMGYKGLPDKLVARISPHEARNYVKALGWTRVPGVNGSVVVFQDPGSDLDQVVIPLNVDASDYGRRMAEVVSNLAERESRPAVEVLNDLLTPPSDVLRFRVQDDATEAGSLPLDRGIDLLQGARKALLASACSVIQPQTFHPRLSRSEAEDLVAASRLGQTERGSYTVTVACPLDLGGESQFESSLPLFHGSIDSPDEDRAEVEVPFTRKVTALLMNSIARIARAADEEDLAPLSRTDAGQVPLSANLCEALLLMQPQGDRSALHLSASWSRAIPSPRPSDAPSLIHLRSESFRVIKTLSQDLKPVREPRRSQYVGLVDALYGDPDGQGQVRGDVQLQLFHQEGSTKANVSLDADDYHRAWKAHGGAGFVSFSGLLVQVGRGHRLEQVQDFRLLSDEEATPSR